MQAHTVDNSKFVAAQADATPVASGLLSTVKVGHNVIVMSTANADCNIWIPDAAKRQLLSVKMSTLLVQEPQMSSQMRFATGESLASIATKDRMKPIQVRTRMRLKRERSHASGHAQGCLHALPVAPAIGTAGPGSSRLGCKSDQGSEWQVLRHNLFFSAGGDGPGTPGGRAGGRDAGRRAAAAGGGAAHRTAGSVHLCRCASERGQPSATCGIQKERPEQIG